MERLKDILLRLVILVVMLSGAGLYMYLRGKIDSTYWNLEKWIWVTFYTTASYLVRAIFIVLLGGGVCLFLYLYFTANINSRKEEYLESSNEQ
jgi:hypothetical protein